MQGVHSRQRLFFLASKVAPLWKTTGAFPGKMEIREQRRQASKNFQILKFLPEAPRFWHHDQIATRIRLCGVSIKQGKYRPRHTKTRRGGGLHIRGSSREISVIVAETDIPT